jgi:hypothetical protein
VGGDVGVVLAAIVVVGLMGEWFGWDWLFEGRLLGVDKSQRIVIFDFVDGHE